MYILGPESTYIQHTLFMKEPSVEYHLCDIRCQAFHSLGPLSPKTSWMDKQGEQVQVFKRHSVAGAVLQTPVLLSP